MIRLSVATLFLRTRYRPPDGTLPKAAILPIPIPMDGVNNDNIPQTTLNNKDDYYIDDELYSDNRYEHKDGVNNDNIPQTTLNNEDIYTSINNNNLHSAQVKTRNKRSVLYDSEDDKLNRDNRDEHRSNKDDYIDDDLSGNNINTHYFGYTTQYDNEDTVDGSAKLNDSSNKDHLYQDDDSMYAEIIYAETPSYNSEGTTHVQLRVDDKYLHRTYYDENDKYEKMDVQEDAADVLPELNGSSNKNDPNQDSEDEKKRDPDAPDS